MALTTQSYRTLQLSHSDYISQYFVFHAKTNYCTATDNRPLLNYKSLVNLFRQSSTNVGTSTKYCLLQSAPRHSVIARTASLSWLGLRDTQHSTVSRAMKHQTLPKYFKAWVLRDNLPNRPNPKKCNSQKVFEVKYNVLQQYTL